VAESSKASGVLGRLAIGDAGPPGAARVPFSTVDVLVVHCDSAFISALTDVLRRHTFSVWAVGSAGDALDAVARGCAPRLVILDVTHPGLEPRRFIADMRREAACAATRFVVLTRASAGRALAGLEVDGTLLKPLEVRELLDVLREHCGLA
jgi:CheY-like chemotaxis protein